MIIATWQRVLFAVFCFALTLRSSEERAAAQAVTVSPDLANVLSFEKEHTGGSPAGGWFANPPRTIFLDGETVHGGRWSIRIERAPGVSGEFSVLGMAVPWDYEGRNIEMRGFLRTENVSGYLGLWMRQDGESSQLALENMNSQQLKGTHDWAEYKIALPVYPGVRELAFGVLLAGTGRAWADDLQLLVDGKPIWAAPRGAPRPQPIVDSDHEFDSGSGISINDLSTIQVQNLATLGKVWGFLKYHHPKLTSGQRHWDYDLFRVLPAVLAARDRDAANVAVLQWVDRLGTLDPCSPCAKLVETDLHLHPQPEWIADSALLGRELSERLRSIRERRPADSKQFYVSQVRGVGNPVFDQEPDYKTIKLPDAGFQLLGLYRFWNIVAYWFPYRDVIGEDWGKILAEFVPRIALARDAGAYRLQMMALIARIHDTHANLWSSLDVRPPVGDCQIPVNVRFVEDVPVVTGSTVDAGTTLPLKPGDVITHIDGVAVSKLTRDWAPYYAASNDPTRLRDIGRSMTKGACGKVAIRIRREEHEIEIDTERISVSASNRGWHDVPGDTFRLLSPEIAYLKLSSVKAEDAVSYVERASGAKALIIDIRNYPSAFMVFALGSLLVDKDTDFVRFTVGDLSNPGAFRWGNPLSLKPQKPHFPGRILILVDEVSQSSAEYTTMALRVSPRSKVFGSTTAGADGNVSPIPLPGGLRGMISGIGVFYPDKKPTQRVGIIPDVVVKPTIAGIRAGRDEVLEAAVREALGLDAPPAQVERIAKP
jgi:C-terminal processing protease CtpA/Prc